MRRDARILAVSLLTMSCAAAGCGGRKGLVPFMSRGGRSEGEKSLELVSTAALGSLKVTKWRLANGFEVISVPDASATSVTYTTWYRVGSRNEDAAAGETGLAHLFEHLMFTQTKGSAEGDFDRRMEEVGASVNAMTSYDFTAYIDNLPPAALSLAIELEADRMVNHALREKEVETEREVVAEERLSSVEDSVDGLLDEMAHLQAFELHPYRFPVIGLMKDIKAVTPEKANRFYRRYYAPNNAVAVVAGRFDEEETLAHISRRFGALAPSRDIPADRAPRERAPKANVRAEVVRPVPADRIVIGLRAPPLGGADRAAYEVLDEVLTGGPSSRLHRRLVVERELASSVNGDVAATRDAGLYSIWVQMTKGHAAAEAEAIVEEEIARIVSSGVSDGELTKARNRIETAFWSELFGSEGRAEKLGEFDVTAGDYRKLLDRGQELARVRAEDVKRVAGEYMSDGARSIVVARTKG